MEVTAKELIRGSKVLNEMKAEIRAVLDVCKMALLPPAKDAEKFTVQTSTDGRFVEWHFRGGLAGRKGWAIECYESDSDACLLVCSQGYATEHVQRVHSQLDVLVRTLKSRGKIDRGIFQMFLDAAKLTR